MSVARLQTRFLLMIDDHSEMVLLFGRLVVLRGGLERGFRQFLHHYLVKTLINFSIGENQMDLQSMVELLNFSKQLVQDGEMSFLCYDYVPRSAEEKDNALRDIIAFREKELRNAEKKGGRKNLRPVILKNLENEKKYEPFQYSDAYFTFTECTLVFRMQEDYRRNEVDFRLVITDRFGNHPSLGSIRYHNGGYEYIFLRSGEDTLDLISSITISYHSW